MDCVFEKNADGKWECLRCHARYNYLPVRQCDADPEKPKPPKPEPSSSKAESNFPPTRGPGDYLHDAIRRWFGEVPKEDCQCRSRIAQMNAWGPLGCREHIGEIVDWLLDKASRRGWRISKLPVIRWAVKRFVLRAINKAKIAHCDLNVDHTTADSIRESFVDFRGRKLDKKLRQALDKNLHKTTPLFCSSSMRVPHSGIGCQ